MSTRFRTITEQEYLKPDSCSGGDYGGMGYIAHVNAGLIRKMAEEDSEAKEHIAEAGMSDWSIRDCLETHKDCPPAVIFAEGGYNSITVYIHPDWAEGREAYESLENYPVLDDEALSEREMELEQESWELDDKNSLTKLVCEAQPDYDYAESWLEENEDWLQTEFHKACEDLNIYREIEGPGNVYWPQFETIADQVASSLRMELDDSAIAAVHRAIRDGLQMRLNLEALV